MKENKHNNEDMHNYLKAGEKLALSLNNRGPIKFNKDGSLHKDILSSYTENGFYIFENVYEKSELLDIENDLLDIFSYLLWLNPIVQFVSNIEKEKNEALYSTNLLSG